MTMERQLDDMNMTSNRISLQNAEHFRGKVKYIYIRLIL